MDFDFFELFDVADTGDSVIETESVTDSVCMDETDINTLLSEEELDLLPPDEDVLSESDAAFQEIILSDAADNQSSDDMLNEMLSEESQDESCSSAEAGMSVSDSVFGPVFKFFDDIYYSYSESDDIVTQDHFSPDGSMDLKNNVLVEGNVMHDIQFTEQQTHGSCSLMAQEQFVHRYFGQAIPEEYLEWAAQKWGVYSPDIGTDINGQTMVLEHFNIPHERFFDRDISDLNDAVSENKDIIIGVDAREFYEDPSCPPGSGHAVAIVGRGVNPETHELEGFYITDSNYPQTAHFVTVEKLQNSWHGDMITVPEETVA